MSDILGGLLGFYNIFSGASIASQGYDIQANTILQGGEIAAAGANLTASGFRESAKAVQGSTAFNVSIQQLNTKNRIDSMLRQGSKLLGQQTAGVSGAGLALSSKSYLAVQNETFDFITNSIKDLKLDLENSIRAETFKSAVTQTRLENEARAAEYRGEVAKVQASNRASEARFAGEQQEFRATSKAIQAIPSLLGGIL